MKRTVYYGQVLLTQNENRRRRQSTYTDYGLVRAVVGCTLTRLLVIYGDDEVERSAYSVC